MALNCFKQTAEIVANARDYCKEHEDKHNGTGYCLNGGECINKAYGKDCNCMSGFGGDQCADEIDECSLNSNLCFNGASCINKWGSYECLCTHGFEGKHCEINRDDCAEHACPDSKVCVDEVDSYSCICPHGRYGENCEFEDICVTSNPCAYGNCSLTSENEYYCDCENGYTGTNCDLDVNECEDEAGEWCLNGKCQNLFGSYKCHCEMGFQGRNCRDLIPHCERNPCQNGGSCLNNYAGHTCLCMPGFIGDNCEIRVDKSCNKDCQNGGICYQQSHCMCPSAFKGELCEIEKPSPCNHDFCGEHGYCSPTENYSSYYCNCENGYHGEHCQIKECASQGECIMSVDLCLIDNVNCSGHGRCLNMKDSYRCECDSGYEGPRCAFSKFSEASDTNLQGNVIFLVTGFKETVIRHLRDIIFQIGRLTYISARIVLTKDGYPKIYEFDPERGIQDLVDTTSVIHPDNKDIVFGKEINPNPPPKTTNTSGTKYNGFMITFRLDISTCLKEKVLKPEIECPEDVEHIAARLLGPMSKVLEPLGIHLEKVEGNNGQDKTPVGHYILYAGFVVVSVLLIISILTTARRKLHYRDRNLCTAAIWTPPKNTNTKGFPGSMTSLNTFTQSHFGGYPQNMSTLTSLGASSMAGSFVSASREQLNKLDHDPASLSPLHHILKMTDDQKVVEEVEKQLNHGADPNATDSMGRTPLMFAVNRRGDVGIRLIELLVSRGADLKRVDRDGLNVLHIAIESTDAFNELVALHLIRNHSEVNVDAAARSEETPLKICARVGDLTEMVVRALLATGQVDVDSIGDEEYPESRRRTALHMLLPKLDP
ncbi:Rabankyrin-5 [Aphelenchoides bicaudatus]|nr:Rabankyrin-5 [Aphelenchoides bicaudatus]